MVTLAFLIGAVFGGALGWFVRAWLDGRPNGTASPGPAPSAPSSAAMVPPVSDRTVCALVDVTGRVISYRQVDTVPPEFTRYHGRGANRRFIRDGEDADGRPQFRLVG